MTATLSYVNIFARDVKALSAFYMTVFGFTEIEEIGSPIFVGVSTGQSCIGFNAYDAYDLLKLAEHSPATGVKFMLNIDVADTAEVEAVTERAVAEGATLVKAPYKTYYNWFQSVLLDPEGNAFRVNVIL